MNVFSRSVSGRRILITGAARGIGAALARRLHERGARIAVVGLEPELLAQVAAACGDAPWSACDVRSRPQVDAVVEMAVDRLGGLDVVVANAGVAAQLPLAGGDPDVFERINAVNVLGTYYTVRAAAPHISHPGGYAVVIASLAAAVHAPLLAAYSASKAAVEVLGNTLRVELRPSGARCGVAYFAELDTDMTSRGFGTEAAAALLRGSGLHRVATLEAGVTALERGIARRSRRIVAPGWVRPVLPLRMAVQPLLDRRFQRGLAEALRIARSEHPPLTTPQPVDQP
ncbi:SDR family NAD(P)-dependent oxidoreductase [Micromonospora aurantiaca (nom. illeg.)]